MQSAEQINITLSGLAAELTSASMCVATWLCEVWVNVTLKCLLVTFVGSQLRHWGVVFCITNSTRENHIVYLSALMLFVSKYFADMQHFKLILKKPAYGPFNITVRMPGNTAKCAVLMWMPVSRWRGSNRSLKGAYCGRTSYELYSDRMQTCLKV